MKKIKGVLLVFMACICLTSCTNWLNLKPFDMILDDELYSTERGINSALNGLYLRMADGALYGKNLTFYTAEILGQRYYFDRVVTDHSPIAYFEFTDSKVRTHIDAIFSTAYNVIRDANYFIAEVEETNVVSKDKKDILLGEAYALRAFLHFDMLRLYGYPPVLDKESRGIPYCTVSTSEWQPIQTNGKVLDLVLNDIESALEYLKNDPILTTGVNRKDDGYDFFNIYRNNRMNFFAVQALKMRVLFYAGDTESVKEAAEIALSLIESEKFQETFPWTKNSSAAGEYVDNITFTDEVVFGIHVASMYDSWTTWFNSSVSSFYEALQTPAESLLYMYKTDNESHLVTNDRRASRWAAVPAFSDYFVTNKFAKPNAKAPVHILSFQPLIRKSEIYLVAAEYYQDTKYVNEIRANRGIAMKPLEDVLSDIDLQEQIRKEYLKDFVSEGQMFFYYKRRAETRIWGRTGIEINISNPGGSYTLPMPRKETEV